MRLWASRCTQGAVHLLGALRQRRRHAWPNLALPLPSLPGPRPIPSPSASARAKECGEAGWAAGTPGFALLSVQEHWGQMRELPPQYPGRGQKDILELGSASGTPQRKGSGRWPFEDFSLFRHLRQNSLPSLVRFLGNQREWVRVTWWLKIFFNQISLGRETLRHSWCVRPPSFEETSLTSLPTRGNQASVCCGLGPAPISPQPRSGVPSKSGGSIPGWGGRHRSQCRRQHLARQRADKYRGEEEGSKGLRLGELWGVGWGGISTCPLVEGWIAPLRTSRKETGRLPGKEWDLGVPKFPAWIGSLSDRPWPPSCPTSTPS